MKNLIAFLFLSCASVFASTPMTCAGLKALGYNYVYFGFEGNPTDVFTMAGSNDGIAWTNLGGTWPTCGNGTPCKVNGPSARQYTDATTGECHIYLLIAEANDANLNSSKQDIGILNTDLSVTNLLTFDWATSLGGCTPNTIFAGRWNNVSGDTNSFLVPVNCTGGTNYATFSTYAATATLTPTSASISAGPTLITTTGVTNGYDPQVIQNAPGSSTCSLVQTTINNALTVSVTALSTGNCPNGPFTFVTDGLSAGVLAAQGTGRFEGPNYFRTNIASQREFYFESVYGTMKYSTCTPIAPTSCTISTPQNWTTSGHSYRNGTVLRVVPVPTSALYGGTISGGTWY